jgi:hypothetical protein
LAFAAAIAACGSEAAVNNAPVDGGGMEADASGDAPVDVARPTDDAQPTPDGAVDSTSPDVESWDGPDAAEAAAEASNPPDAGCAAEITCPPLDPTMPAHIDCVAPASLHVGDSVTLDIVGTNLAAGTNPPIVEVDVVSPPGMGGQTLNGTVIDACHVQAAYVVPSQSGQVSVVVSPGGTIGDSNKVVLAVHN